MERLLSTSKWAHPVPSAVVVVAACVTLRELHTFGNAKPFTRALGVSETLRLLALERTVRERLRIGSLNGMAAALAHSAPMACPRAYKATRRALGADGLTPAVCAYVAHLLGIEEVAIVHDLLCCTPLPPIARMVLERWAHVQRFPKDVELPVHGKLEGTVGAATQALRVIENGARYRTVLPTVGASVDEFHEAVVELIRSLRERVDDAKRAAEERHGKYAELLVTARSNGADEETLRTLQALALAGEQTLPEQAERHDEPTCVQLLLLQRQLAPAQAGACVEVRPSTVVDAMGVFTTAPCATGTVLTMHPAHGVVLHGDGPDGPAAPGQRRVAIGGAPVELLAKRDVHTPALCGHMLTDAAVLQGDLDAAEMARYVRASTTRANCVALSVCGCAVAIVAVRDLDAGEECFLSCAVQHFLSGQAAN